MILDSLRLNNIRSHRDTTIEFPRGGITLLYGDVGSGKSTVLMGIEFALFGTGPSKSDSLLSISADSGEVMLVFYVGSTKYEVGRSLRRSGQKITQDSKNAYLRVDDVLEPVTTSQLKVRILEVLGLNEPSSANSKSRIYRYAIFTPQDMMKEILWDSGRRLETIRKIFRMEDYHNAIKNTDVLRRALHDSITRFEERFEGLEGRRSDLAEADARAKALARTMEERSKEEQALAGQESQAKLEVGRYEERLGARAAVDRDCSSTRSKMAGEEQIRAKYEGEIKVSQGRLAEIARTLEEIEEGSGNRDGARSPPTAKSVLQLDGEISRFARINERLVEARTEAVSAGRRIAALEQRLSRRGTRDATALEEAASADEARAESLRGDLESAKSSYENHNSGRIRASQEIRRLEASITELQGLGARCHLCGQALTEEHLQRQGQERRRMMEDARKEHGRLDGLCRQESARADEISRRRDETVAAAESARRMIPDARDYARESSALDGLQAELKDLDAQNTVPEEPGFSAKEALSASGARHATVSPVAYLTALRDALVRYEESERRAGDLKKQREHLEEVVARARAAHAESEERTQSLGAELEQLSRRLAEYADDEHHMARAKADRDRITDLLGRARQDLAACGASLQSEKQNIARIDAEIEAAVRWKEEHARYTAYKRWLEDFFGPNVSQIEKSVLLSTQDAFNKAYHEWYSKLVDDPTKDSRIDEDFAPVIEQDGFVQNVEYLSGGEKTSVALAYRLALNSVMKSQAPSLKSNLLILDEPTDGLSRSQLGHVRDLLQTLNSEQIILVSHEEDLKAHADHVFIVTKNSGGVTRVSLEKGGAAAVHA